MNCPRCGEEPRLITESSVAQIFRCDNCDMKITLEED